MKKIMVILILVALILTSIFIFQNVKANASEVSVISYSSYVAPSNTVAALAPGDLITVGEVMNIGSDIVSDVTVQGTAFSASGQTLAVTGADAFVYDMLPGQKAPFYLDFSASSGLTQDLSWVPQVSSVTVQVTSVTDTNQRQYSDYDIQGRYNYTDANGVYVAYGTLVNNGSQIVSYPWVVTTFYNATGGVISLNYTNYLTPTLSVNGAVRYFSTPLDNNTQLTNQIAAYSIQIDSLTVANSTSSPTSSPTNTPTITPTPTSTSTVSSISSPSPTPTPTLTPPVSLGPPNSPNATPTSTPSQSPTTTPTIPEFSALAIPFLIIVMAVAGLLVFFKKHQHKTKV